MAGASIVLNRSRTDGFSGLIDRSVWITDGRIAVEVGEEGCLSFDYHGLQPCGANAAVFRRSRGALRFSLVLVCEEAETELPIRFQKVRYSVWGIETQFSSASAGPLSGRLLLTAADRSLLIDATVQSARGGESAALRLYLEEDSLYTDVHGARTWEAPVDRDGVVLLEARNRVLLCDWVAAKHEYLVPPTEHARIFEVDEGVDVTRLSERPPVRPWVFDSDEIFVDARIHAAIGGEWYRTRKEAGTWILTSRPAALRPGEAGRLPKAAVCFGDDSDQAQRGVESATRSQGEPVEPNRLQEDRYRTLLERIPTMEIPGRPEIGELFSQIPLAVEGAKIREAGAVRASASSYYWVWGWDSLVTGHEMARFGDLDYQRRLIRFVLAHRAFDGSIPHRWGRRFEVLQTGQFGVTDSLLASLAYAHQVAAGDGWTGEEVYPALRTMYRRLLEKTDERGYYRGIGVYPDHPRLMGRTSESVVCQEIFAYYLFSRIIQAFAHRLGDDETAFESERVAERIEAHFIADFYDPKRGALVDHLTESGARAATYPSYSYVGLMHGFGFDLIRPRVPEIGRFFAEHLVREQGVGVMPVWDRFRDTEPVHASWYPHWDRYVLKTLRRAGEQAAIERYVELLCSLWRAFEAVPELVRIDTPESERWNEHGQLWNLNCATGVYGALLEGVLGIEEDLGGITCVPCCLSWDVEVRGLHLLGSRWDVRVRGRGRYYSEIRVDGEKAVGTWKVSPSSLSSSAKPQGHRLELVRTDRLPDHPVLAEAAGATVHRTAVRTGRLEAVLSGSGNVYVVVCSAHDPVIRWNGRTLSCRRLGGGNRYTVRVPMDSVSGLLEAIAAPRATAQGEGKHHADD